MTKIKFCGLCRPEDARVAAELGADFVGVILTASPRKVTPRDARRILDGAPGVKRVGVVGRESATAILDAAREADLDVLQLHAHFGHEEIARLRQEFEGSLWTVVGVDAETGRIVESWREIADSGDAVLLDTAIRGRAGGTGTPFDWSSAVPMVREIELETRVLVAGGLTPENVASAIEHLHPWAVDVSSGIEVTPRRKSPELMSAFANAVRSASIV